jgi:hypothetical protein
LSTWCCSDDTLSPKNTICLFLHLGHLPSVILTTWLEKASEEHW